MNPNEGGYLVPTQVVDEIQWSDNLYRRLMPRSEPVRMTLRLRLRILKADLKDWLHRRLFPEYVNDEERYR